MGAKLTQANLTPQVLEAIKELQEEDAQAFCTEIDMIIDRIILFSEAGDEVETLDSLKTLQQIKRTFSVFVS